MSTDLINIKSDPCFMVNQPFKSLLSIKQHSELPERLQKGLAQFSFTNPVLLINCFTIITETDANDVGKSTVVRACFQVTSKYIFYQSSIYAAAIIYFWSFMF